MKVINCPWLILFLQRTAKIAFKPTTVASSNLVLLDMAVEQSSVTECFNCPVMPEMLFKEVSDQDPL